MDVVSTCPLPVGTSWWESRPGERMLTVCVKATLTLVPGQTATLAQQQEPIQPDVYWDPGSDTSLYSPSDYVPTKPKVDIVLSGHAHAPGARPVDSLVARVVIDDWSKSLLVMGPRAWVAGPDGPVPSAPRPFARLPLRYDPAWELAAPSPNVPPPHFERHPQASAVDMPPGFAPLTLGQRAVRLGTRPDIVAWARALMTAKSPISPPPPDGIDYALFNVAPRDQQRNNIEASPRVLLENLHPTVAQFETRLPALAPRVTWWDSRTDKPTDIRMRIDTLRFDTDRGLCIVSHRGLLPTTNLDVSTAKLGVLLEGPGQTATMDELLARLRKTSGKSFDFRGTLPVSPDAQASTQSANPGLPASFSASAASVLAVPSAASAAPKVRPAPSDLRQTIAADEPGLTNTVPGTNAPAAAPLPFAGLAGGARMLAPLPPVPTGLGLPFAGARPAAPVVVQEAPPIVHDEPPPRVVVDVGDVAPPPMIGPIVVEKSAEPQQNVAPNEAPASAEETPEAPEETPPTEILPVQRCATIAGLHDMADDPQALLEREGVSRETLDLSLEQWTQCIAVDTQRDDFALLAIYDEAYVAALEKARGPISVDEYASLSVAIERGTGASIVQELDLPPGALFRIERIWMRKTMKDSELDAAVTRAIAQARRS